MAAIEGVTVSAAATPPAKPVHALDERKIAAEVRAETTRLLYRTPVTYLVNLINGAIFAAVSWGAYPRGVILLWLAILYAVVGLRIVNWRSFRSRRAGSEEEPHWARRFALGAFATGLLWGLAGLAIFLRAEPSYIVFVAFVIGGMAAGAVAQHAVYLPALFSFLLPAVLPLAAAFLFQDSTISLAMGLMTVVFAGALAFLGRDLNRSLVRNFRLHAEFRSLTGNLEDEIARRKHAEVELAHLARHDVLTGLPNRAAFFERLKLEIGRAKRGETRFAVHYIDLDHFKEANDRFGHQVGDQLLTVIAEQLSQSVRLVDLVARLGGDEFAILQAGVHSRSDGDTLAVKLIDKLSGIFDIAGHRIKVSPSIGIALYDSDTAGADTILEQADLAMYKAKAEGRQRFRWYEPDSPAEDKTRS